MTLRFNLDIDVESNKWDDESQKEVFIENFTDVVQKGLEVMTVPDWTVKNVTVEEVEE
jgi:hypothetical protein